MTRSAHRGKEGEGVRTARPQPRGEEGIKRRLKKSIIEKAGDYELTELGNPCPASVRVQYEVRNAAPRGYPNCQAYGP